MKLPVESQARPFQYSIGAIERDQDAVVIRPKWVVLSALSSTNEAVPTQRMDKANKTRRYMAFMRSQTL